MNVAKTIQGVFDFESGNPDGFENWRRQQEARLDAIRREWCVPVGRKVRIRLYDIDGEFTGKLQLAEHPVTIDRHAPLHLKVDHIDFFVPDVEQCTVVE